jgi:hypothetical protein
VVAGEGKHGEAAYQDGLIDKQNASVGLEVYPGSLLHDLKALDGNIRLVGEAEANQIQHFVSWKMRVISIGNSRTEVKATAARKFTPPKLPRQNFQ